MGKRGTLDKQPDRTGDWKNENAIEDGQRLQEQAGHAECPHVGRNGSLLEGFEQKGRILQFINSRFSPTILGTNTIDLPSWIEPDLIVE